MPTSWKRAREERVPSDARDRDDPILQWLPQRLEDRARKLRQLVEEEHAVMSECADCPLIGVTPVALDAQPTRRRRRNTAHGYGS